MTERPVLALERDAKAAEEFVGGLQEAIDASDADLSTGPSPEMSCGGALRSRDRRLRRHPLDPFPDVHSTRERQAQGAGGGSRYEIEQARVGPTTWRSHTCGGSRSRTTRKSSRGEPTRSTSLPCSCSSGATEPGGWPPGSIRLTGVTFTADTAPAVCGALVYVPSTPWLAFVEHASLVIRRSRIAIAPMARVTLSRPGSPRARSLPQRRGSAGRCAHLRARRFACRSRARDDLLARQQVGTAPELAPR